MNKCIILLLSAFLLVSFAPGTKDKACRFTITWKFTDIEPGYDHENKMMVWIDGEKAGESSVKRESAANSMTLLVPVGSHRVKVVNYAHYKGVWEPQTPENNYSLNCSWEEEVMFKKKRKLEFIFNLGSNVAVKLK